MSSSFEELDYRITLIGATSLRRRELSRDVHVFETGLDDSGLYRPEVLRSPSAHDKPGGIFERQSNDRLDPTVADGPVTQAAYLSTTAAAPREGA